MARKPWFILVLVGFLIGQFMGIWATKKECEMGLHKEWFQKGRHDEKLD